MDFITHIDLRVQPRIVQRLGAIHDLRAPIHPGQLTFFLLAKSVKPPAEAIAFSTVILLL